MSKILIVMSWLVQLATSNDLPNDSRYHGKGYIAVNGIWKRMHDVLDQPCPTRRPRYTFLAPSVSTLFETIININSNFKTKTFLNV
jgi:hypothetical protein